MKPLNVFFATSETTPYAKTGGLADVSGALPPAVAALGAEVKLVMPLYRSVMDGDFGLKLLDEHLNVLHRGRVLSSRVYMLERGPRLNVYFIRRDEFFDRKMLYGTPEGDYFDNADRFIFFSRAVFQLGKLLAVKPDIIHCNDWQTGLIPVYLKNVFQDDPFFRKTRTLLTIHNLAYQGVFPGEYMEISGLPASLFSMQGLEYYGKMNFVKGGILFSDLINTVSEKYSLEIRTPEFGQDLDGVLRGRSADIFGVLNGVDYEQWNPSTDPFLAANYGPGDLAGKKKCKEDLLRVYGLDENREIPVIGVISRLAGQKGFDILAEAMEEILRLNLYLVILGTGDAKYEKQFAEIGRKHRDRVGVRIDFDNALAHKIEAGSDMFLMPSRYEPCGLNQMYSLKYGTIPVVRATGGLDDTILEFDPETGEGNGFKFEEYSSGELVKAVKRARWMYEDKDHWQKIVSNAMSEDFSWGRSAKKYMDLYRKALTKS